MNLRIHHVAMTIRNVGESIEWYQRNLDAEVIERYSKHGLEIVHLTLGEARLELFGYGVGTEVLPEYRKELITDVHVVGTKHVCLETDDLDGLRQKLVKNNVEFATEVDTAGFGGQYVFIRDPNGILIELYQA